MTTESKNLYENGCACVRWFSHDHHYEVLYSPDGNTKKARSDMFLVGRYKFDENGGETHSSEKDIAPAKALCDRWSVPPEEMIDSMPVVYKNGCAAVVRHDGEGGGIYKIRVKNKEGTDFIDTERFDEEYGFKFIHGQKSEEEALAKAKERCNEYAGRDDGWSIKPDLYPDLHDPTTPVVFGSLIGGIAFLLYWIGFALKSNFLLAVGDVDRDCLLGETIGFLFTGNGLDFITSHWLQIGLLIIISLVIGIAFWVLGRIRRFSITYRLFVRAFGKVQAICTGVVWGVVGLYWTVVGLWRSIISPIPDALGYPHFIAVAIYLAVIVWGIVDFMKHRKRFPGNFSTNAIGAAS